MNHQSSNGKGLFLSKKNQQLVCQSIKMIKFYLPLQLLLPSWTFQSKRLSNSRLPCFENTLRHLLSDVKDELEPNNRQEAVTTQYRKPGMNLQHKTNWKRETIMVLLPLTCQNIIDLVSSIVNQTSL